MGYGGRSRSKYYDWNMRTSYDSPYSNVGYGGMSSYGPYSGSYGMGYGGGGGYGGYGGGYGMGYGGGGRGYGRYNNWWDY